MNRAEWRIDAVALALRAAHGVPMTRKSPLEDTSTAAFAWKR